MSISAIIDIAIVLIILVSAGVSFFRGFVREVLTIFGVFGGAAAAWFFGGKFAPIVAHWLGVEEGKKPEKLFDIIPYDILANVCAYAGIFIAVFLVLQLISYFVSASVKAIGLGPVDRALGVIFGIARALLFLGIIYLVLGSLIPDDNKKEILGKSKTIVYVEAVSDWLKSFLPEDSAPKTSAEVKDKAINATRESLEKIQVLGKDAAEQAGDKLSEQKEKLKDSAVDAEKSLKENTTGYSPAERKDMNQLIENNNDGAKESSPNE